MTSSLKHFGKGCSQTAQSFRFGRIFRQTERVRALSSLGDGAFPFGDGVHIQSKDGPHHRLKHKPGITSCSWILEFSASHVILAVRDIPVEDIARGQLQLKMAEPWTCLS